MPGFYRSLFIGKFVSIVGNDGWDGGVTAVARGVVKGVGKGV